MPKSILVGQVEEVIENKGGAYLESYKLFDIYEGAQIKAGFKSVAYSITFRAKDKTLEEADISAAMNRILKALTEYASLSSNSPFTGTPLYGKVKYTICGGEIVYQD